jgi:hypothetical protein
VRRRPTVTRKPAKKRLPNPSKPKRSKASKAVGPKNPSKQPDLPRLTRECDEALERETATSEILHLISTLPGDLQPVFQAILENVTRICDAKFAYLYRF